MFGGKSNTTDSKTTRTTPAAGPMSVNQINKDLVIQGDITGKGVLRLDGKINGNLKIEGKVIIGGTGYFEGLIECEDADISGKVIGKIDAIKSIAIKSGGVVEGEIEYEQLTIDLDGYLNGKSTKRMGKPSAPKIEKPQTPQGEAKPAGQS